MLNLFASQLAKRTPVLRVQHQLHAGISHLIWRRYSTGSEGHSPGGGGGMQGFPGLNFGSGKMEKGQALAEFVGAVKFTLSCSVLIFFDPQECRPY